MSNTHTFYKAESYRVESSVGYLVNKLAQTLGRELDRRMIDLGLTDAQWKPLLLLQQDACSTAADISRISCHDNGAVTRLLDRLQNKGLVQRLRSAEDRRVVNLALTEEGERIFLCAFLAGICCSAADWLRQLFGHHAGNKAARRRGSPRQR